MSGGAAEILVVAQVRQTSTKTLIQFGRLSWCFEDPHMTPVTPARRNTAILHPAFPGLRHDLLEGILWWRPIPGCISEMRLGGGATPVVESAASDDDGCLSRCRVHYDARGVCRNVVAG